MIKDPAASVPPSTSRPIHTDPSDAQRRFDDLREIAMSFVVATDLRATLDRIVDGILRVAGCDRGHVILFDADGSWATYTGRWSDRRNWEEDEARLISHTVVNEVIATRKAFIIANTQESDGLRASTSIQEGKIRSVACLPLLDGDRVAGVIYADSTHVRPELLDADRGILQVFGLMAGFAVENAKRQGELQDRSDRLAEENAALSRQLFREFAMGGTISKSPAMLDVFEMVSKVAPAEITVLIRGESGTGKERIARAIHARSNRRERPFLALNCGGMPEHLVESTLFGSSKGAFTSAEGDRQGYFEAAEGGTLFLDEVGELPLPAQANLLRVLEVKEFARVGEVRVRRADVRIISATNRDLERSVAEGRFREDLFYRISKANIEVPPLRNRREDIIPLAEHFLDAYVEETKNPRPRLSADAKAALLTHSWPGNVRELKTAVEGGILFRDPNDIVDAKALERFIQARERVPVGDPSPSTLREQLERAEEHVIRQALAANDNNVAVTAKLLDLSRQHLYTKIHKYGITLRLDD